jgi:hypothetical protein
MFSNDGDYGRRALTFFPREFFGGGENTLGRGTEAFLGDGMSDPGMVKKESPILGRQSAWISFSAEFHRHFAGEVRIGLRADQVIERCHLDRASSAVIGFGSLLVMIAPYFST